MRTDLPMCAGGDADVFWVPLRSFRFLRTVATLGFLLAWVPTQLVSAGQTITPVFQGITLIRRTEVFPRPIHINIALIDLQADGVRFKLTPPQGSRETRPQTTFEFLTQENAQVAVNCHFFLPFPALGQDLNVTGFAASEGVLYSPFEPQPTAPGFPDQSYAILPNAPAMNIDPSNRVTILHADLSDATGRSALESVVLGNAFSGSAQIVTDGVVTIPHYGSEPGMLTERNGYSEDYAWYDFHLGRTAAGISRDGRTLVLFTVDSVAGSAGMSVREVAEMLVQDYDVVQALNLDGDGSTTLVAQDPVSLQGTFVNVPGEFPSGRSVGSSLAVFALPLRLSDPTLTISPAPPGCIRIAWARDLAGWQVESTDDLTAGPWMPVQVNPRIVGDRSVMILSVSEGYRFFRLIPSQP